MSTLDRAIEIAVQAHRHQLDKGGAPYILHPLRVMMAVETTEERMVAVLHDVVEDSNITLDDLMREGFTPAVVEAIGVLTRRRDEDYKTFIRRCSLNSLARTVKMADLSDNMDLRRIANPTAEDRRRASKYYNALADLRKCK